MIEAKAFAVGLAKLAAAVRQPLDDLTLEVYHEQVAGLGDTDEWEGYVARCLAEGSWPDWLPKLEELRAGFLRWRAKAAELKALPEDTRSVEEKREAFRASYAGFKAELERHGFRLERLARPMEGR